MCSGFDFVVMWSIWFSWSNCVILVYLVSECIKWNKLNLNMSSGTSNIYTKLWTCYVLLKVRSNVELNIFVVSKMKIILEIFFFDNFIKEPGLWQNYFTLVLKVPKNENLIGNVFRTYVRLVWVDILAFGLVDIFAFGLNSNEKWDFNKKEIILLIKV